MIFFRKIKYDQLSDEELIRRYSSSENTEYVGELFSRYSHLVFGICLNFLKDRNDSKDAVITIFERIIHELKKQEVDKFKNWLFSVSRNYCLNQIRSKNRLSLREKIFSDEFENEIVSETELTDNEQEVEIIQQAIKELKEEQSICIHLFYFEQKSYADIVVETGYSNEQVKSYIQNGKRNLKNILNSNYER